MNTRNDNVNGLLIVIAFVHLNFIHWNLFSEILNIYLFRYCYHLSPLFFKIDSSSYLGKGEKGMSSRCSNIFNAQGLKHDYPYRS